MKDFTPELNTILNPKNVKNCKACGLFTNQLPVKENKEKGTIFWVGLSAVEFSNDDEKIPLAPNTRTGALIAEIEQKFNNHLDFYKTNLVKCLPLKKDNKIRYPSTKEMDKCFPNLLDELAHFNPRLVFLLGKQVAANVLKQYGIKEFGLATNYSYQTYEVDSLIIIPIHHPSYILVYKRKYLQKYIEGVRDIIESVCSVPIPKHN